LKKGFLLEKENPPKNFLRLIKNQLFSTSDAYEKKNGLSCTTKFASLSK